MDNLIGFQRDQLYVIAGFDPLSGQDVSKELESYFEPEITHGRLYSNLDTLVEEGDIEKDEINRRTNSSGITAAGRDSRAP